MMSTDIPHRQVREGLRRQHALRRRPAGALVADRRDRPLRRGEFFQFIERQQQLRAVQLLALATTKELLLEPRDLPAQHRILLAQELHFIEGDGGRAHRARSVSGSPREFPPAKTIFAQRSYHPFIDPCRSSMPPMSSASASGARTSFLRSLLGFGQEKRPCSSRFANTHTPVPSQYSSYSRVRSLLMKQNTAPDFGSSPSYSCTGQVSVIQKCI
jgi:hypothetical protein